MHVSESWPSVTAALERAYTAVGTVVVQHLMALGPAKRRYRKV
jgi:hypothetical protein